MKETKTVFRAVVAHPVPAEQTRIASILEKDGLFEVTCATHDGLECLRQVLTDRPALLVIDTVLEQVDGLEVLRQLGQITGAKPRCLMITSYGNYVREYARCLGADYCLIAPYSDKALADNARMLVQPPAAFFTDQEIDAVTVRVLQELDVPSRLKGYPYVKEGVRLLVRDPELVRRRRVVKELYGVIAANHHISKVQPIERAMRTLVDHVFSHSDPACLAKYLSSADLRQSHATNTDFLTALAQFVRTTLEADRRRDQPAARQEN